MAPGPGLCSVDPMSMNAASAGPSTPEQYDRGFRRIATLLISLVTVPTAVLLVIGILMLTITPAGIDLVLGILVFAVVVCLVTGSVLVLFHVRRESRLSRLQTDFVSKVSHELKTPLTGIRLFAESLQSGRIGPSDMQACTDGLVREAARLEARIDRLLRWGRMEAGAHPYDRRPEEVRAVIEEAIDAFATGQPGDRALVCLDLAGGRPPRLGDRGALVEAVAILLTNAGKYSESAPEITVRAALVGPQVRIDVIDQGIGIPHAEHTRIFQRFYRVDERLAGGASGFGLGLAIVRHVVEGHGGRIELISEPGRGSTFSLFLPAAEGPSR